jgi:uncharacterized membrane protein
MKEIGLDASERLTRYVGSWAFVLIYTVTVISWAILHKLQILTYDSTDLTLENIWLAYLAGIQASIVLMADRKSAYEDKIKHAVALQKEEEGLQMLSSLMESVKELEALVQEMEEDDERIEKERTGVEDRGA